MKFNNLFLFSLTLFISFLCVSNLSAQNKKDNLELKTITDFDTLFSLALEKSPELFDSKSEILKSKEDHAKRLDLLGTEIGVHYGEYNSELNDIAFEVKQTIPFPTRFQKNKKVFEKKIDLAKVKNQNLILKLKKELRILWAELILLNETLVLNEQLISSYQTLLDLVKVKFNFGEISNSGVLIAEIKLLNAKTLHNRNSYHLKLKERDILLKIGLSELDFQIDLAKSKKDFLSMTKKKLQSNENNLEILVLEQEQALIENQIEKLKQHRLPNINLGYINQSLIGIPKAQNGLTNINDRFESFTLSLEFPFFNQETQRNIKGLKLDLEVYKNITQQKEKELKNRKAILFNRLTKGQKELNEFQERLIEKSNQLLELSHIEFKLGKISQEKFINRIIDFNRIKKEKLESDFQYHLLLINWEYYNH